MTTGSGQEEDDNAPANEAGASWRSWRPVLAVVLALTLVVLCLVVLSIRHRG